MQMHEPSQARAFEYSLTSLKKEYSLTSSLRLSLCMTFSSLFFDETGNNFFLCG